MEIQTLPIQLVEDELWIAQNNVKEFKQALGSIDDKDVLELRDVLRKIPGGLIKHPFGYYEIPYFSDVDVIHSAIPFRFPEDDDPTWKEHIVDTHGRFDGKFACVRKSHFDLRNRINTVVCGKFEVQSEEQVLEHEIRHGLETHVFGMHYSVKEGFALSTHSGESRVSQTKDWERDPAFWRNVFHLVQEKGLDEVKLLKKWAPLFDVKYHPATDYEEYTQGRNATQSIIKELGGDKPSDFYIATKKTAWTNYRYKVYTETKQFLKNKGVLKLRTLDQIVEEYALP